MSELTRSEYYKLSQEGRAFAGRLAGLDPRTVDRKLCQEFNVLLARVQTYDLLQTHVGEIKPARPINQVMVLSGYVMLSLLITLVLAPRLSQQAFTIYATAWPLGLLVLFFVPPARYGTSIEQLEGKLLRIVEGMEKILQGNPLNVTEAVYFQVKETLDDASAELHQQIYLANERSRR